MTLLSSGSPPQLLMLIWPPPLGSSHHMVTLLTKRVSPSVEGKMVEKREKDGLEQADSMMVTVSIIA